MIEVLPAILPKTFSELAEQVGRVADLVPWVQVDIVDGVFAPEATWPFNDDPREVLEKLQSGELTLPHKGKVRFELDLMVKAPEVILDTWIAAGFERFIIHVESTEDLSRIITRLKAADCGVGIALKPSTDSEELAPFIESIDFVQCMGSDVIGYHGVSLDPQVLEKLTNLHSRYPELQLGIDIGVTFETAPQLIAAGVSRLAVGSLILKSENPEEVIRKLQGEAV